ncbi:CaiB/BaiF CoA transferase family protein [Pseudomonas oligotrophica]|uniref:CaiB/BaiF CoA transferase family protein n=1 Tax=Pseudomonas oligotrophica TaxID=2912055 RepID=UPI001F37AA38|nr:CaiB/BaiF CoA-transferase family protein [Pseudomonas oligotrophica]MCF7202607.1 CoA transferase [Pseudomonas oligotrophica]
MNPSRDPGAGPLAGLRVLEFAGIGPGPHCAMLLADMGAEVIRIQREGGNGWPNPVVDRGRRVVTLDIREPAGQAHCLALARDADVLIEGFRPGVMERLGLGPEALLAVNPRLVYGRITGWGQDGPLATAAGHDINYIALSGALAAIRDKDGEPVPPLNLVGDFGGGSLFLTVGILAALLERERSGRGQVVDAAIVDGVSSLMSFFAGLLPGGRLSLAREANPLSGAAPNYRCYRCADGGEIAIGPLEPKFWAELLERIDAPAWLRDGCADPAQWAEQGAALEQLFASRTREQWCALLEGSDACFAPVLGLEEAASHPHMQARGVYQLLDGVLQVAPTPRFSRTPGQARASVEVPAEQAGWQGPLRGCGD